MKKIIPIKIDDHHLVLVVPNKEFGSKIKYRHISRLFNSKYNEIKIMVEENTYGVYENIFKKL